MVTKSSIYDYFTFIETKLVKNSFSQKTIFMLNILMIAYGEYNIHIQKSRLTT